MTAAAQAIPQPVGGWLRTMRQVLNLTQATVAEKSGISQQAYAQFETGEASSTISLGRLRHAAAAMDCELVYFLMPRQAQAKSVAKRATVLEPDLVRSHSPVNSGALLDRAMGELPVELR
jgi:transcriptional regulator with XRE-family HTH domain